MYHYMISCPINIKDCQWCNSFFSTYLTFHTPCPFFFRFFALRVSSAPLPEFVSFSATAFVVLWEHIPPAVSTAPPRNKRQQPFLLVNPPLLEANFATQSPCQKFAVSEHLARLNCQDGWRTLFAHRLPLLWSGNFCIQRAYPPSAVILKLASIPYNCVCTLPYHTDTATYGLHNIVPTASIYRILPPLCAQLTVVKVTLLPSTLMFTDAFTHVLWPAQSSKMSNLLHGGSMNEQMLDLWLPIFRFGHFYRGIARVLESD